MTATGLTLDAGVDEGYGTKETAKSVSRFPNRIFSIDGH